MIKLSIEERQQLVALLQHLPELANEQSRRQVLELSGLKQLLPMIDISGSPFIAINHIISYLSNYGRLTYDHETLGLFLSLIKNFVGVQQKDYIDALLIKHNMMTSIVLSPDIREWQGTETVTEVQEKIIGENTLHPIAFLAQGLNVARCVVYIGIHIGSERWSGTGFLITPDLILTNNHVVPDASLLPDAVMRFNYEENFKGEAQQSYEYRTKLDGIYYTNKKLDYTILQLEGSPGNEWGWLPLIPRVVKKNERINIIQHPNGQPKQISLQNNFVEYVGGNVVQYVTSTLPGSSGSPVFNNNWEVVALHHAGGTIREPTTQHTYFRNEGILIGSILTDLPPDLYKVVTTIVMNQHL